LFKALTAECGGNSRTRREAIEAWASPLTAGGFGWVAEPVLNPFTRIAVEMCAARGVLRVVGYEKPSNDALPEVVTQPREVIDASRVIAA
jgi:hypothetical protein